MALEATLSKDKKQLIITVDLSEPRVSGTGRSRLVASATKKTEVEIDGYPVTIILNCCIPLVK